MTLAQQVGQLFMVGTPADEVDRPTQGADPPLPRGQRDAHRPQPRRRARAGAGLADDAGPGLERVDRRRAALRRHRPGGRPGAGAAGPRLLEDPDRARAGPVGAGARCAPPPTVWAGQLRRAGVNLNLAPGPRHRPEPHAPPSTTRRSASSTGSSATPRHVVARHGVAFLDGMADGGVATAVKHFPGSAGCAPTPTPAPTSTDRVTRRHDPYLAPFQAADRRRTCRS